MRETWLQKDKLCSIDDDKIRLEFGPQLIELPCTDENLRNEVTSAHYRIGARDALGRMIRPEESGTEVDLALGKVSKGEKMVCVDWRARFKPFVWKIYLLENGKFQKHGEVPRFDEARDIARRLLEDM